MPSRPSAPRRRALACLLAILGLAVPAAAQPTSPAQPDPTQPGADQPVRLHPGVQLGRRALATLAARKVIPVVVVVPDPASYAHAIAGWTPEAVYPVLIDDGTVQGREDIARFVRGFRPESVVRWEAGEDATPAGGRMRSFRAVRNARRLADEALAAAWDFEPEGAGEMNAAQLAGALIVHWVQSKQVPPGVVFADERDPAWTAALALCAARGQPIIWGSLPSLAIDAALTQNQIDQLCAHIEMACDQTRLPWRGLGDALDAVTVCAALPARYETGTEEFNASTDRLGRLADGTRWAYAGQIFGSEPQAAYRAMCAVFLSIESAWLFDGYHAAEPWTAWDCTAAAEPLKASGVTTMLDDEPRNKLDDWKLRAQLPVRAELICVNSSGNRAWFDLGGTKGWSGDLPLLEVPSAIYMVHSWSAAAPGQKVTLAGRWFGRGAFAYAGSVHEPYLQAFVPTPVVTGRMMTGMAFGAAVRVDGGPPWRIAVLGDPLFASGPRPERPGADLPLEGATTLTEQLKAEAGAGRYAEMYATLNLLGRDANIARLFEAMLRDKPQALDAGVASAALFALFRAGADASFIRAYAVLPPQSAGEVNAVDALWHVGRRVAREGGDYREAALGLMAAHPRERQADADAAELRRLSR